MGKRELPAEGEEQNQAKREEYLAGGYGDVDEGGGSNGYDEQAGLLPLLAQVHEASSMTE